MKMTVNGRTVTLLDKDDHCPICDASRDKMVFSWNMFHGEANSSCCGATYQIKDYFIDNPTEEEKEYLKLLAGDYIEFVIKDSWIEPLKEAMKELSESMITNEVVKLASNKVAAP